MAGMPLLISEMLIFTRKSWISDICSTCPVWLLNVETACHSDSEVWNRLMSFSHLYPYGPTDCQPLTKEPHFHTNEQSLQKKWLVQNEKNHIYSSRSSLTIRITVTHDMEENWTRCDESSSFLAEIKVFWKYWASGTRQKTGLYHMMLLRVLDWCF